MLKHPARHYVHYLLSRRIYDVKAIIQEVETLELPIPELNKGVEEFTQQILKTRQKMIFPAGFNPHAAEPNEATLAFLQKWKILDVWQNSRFVGAAADLLSFPAVRRMLELLLLSPMAASHIAKRVSQRFSLPFHAMNVGVVAAYKHYFWDPEALSSSEWRAFLQDAVARDSEDYCLALQTPRNAAGVAFILSIVDKDPRLLNIADRYRMSSAVGFQLFMKHALGAKGSGETYAAYAALNIMRTSDLELEKYQGGDSEIIEELRRFHTVHDQTKPLTINDLNFVRPVLAITAEGEEVENESKSDG